MLLTHRFSVPARLDAAWAAFSRLDQIAPCFPGATVTDVDGRDYGGFVKIKFGPIPLTYAGTARVTELDRDAGRLVFRAQGQDRRGNGTATADVTATLTETGQITDVQVRTDLSLTGRPAQFGRGVVSDVSDRLLDLFVNCVSARFRDGDLAADPREADAEETMEIPVVRGDEPPAAAGAAAEAAAGAAAQLPPRGGSYAYRPPMTAAQPDLQVVATLLPIVLKRYWPLLVAAAIGIAIGRRILRRRRSR
jgi:uncharacterized protein